MVNSKENDKFDLGVKGLKGRGVKGSAANNTMSSHLEMVNETPEKEFKKRKSTRIGTLYFFSSFYFVLSCIFFILTLK